jgi:hypothetical protein
MGEINELERMFRDTDNTNAASELLNLRRGVAEMSGLNPNIERSVAGRGGRGGRGRGGRGTGSRPPV